MRSSAPAMTVVTSVGPASPAAFFSLLEIAWFMDGRTGRKRRVSANGSAGERRVSRLVLRVWPSGRDGQVTLEAWLERGDTRRTLLRSTRALCEAASHGRWLHADITAEGRRLLALTVAEDTGAPYVHCDLPRAAGIPGGTYEPPTVHIERIPPDAR